MLAFPQAGPRRDYFGDNVRDAFGPVHRLGLYLQEGGSDNRHKSIFGFENMLVAFTLPISPSSSLSPAPRRTRANEENDPFLPVRHMWECCRKLFELRVTPSWLNIIGKSAGKWVGRNTASWWCLASRR
eukprot:6185407-Pleurochrysis_carterae.AAC.1